MLNKFLKAKGKCCQIEIYIYTGEWAPEVVNVWVNVNNFCSYLKITLNDDWLFKVKTITMFYGVCVKCMIMHTSWYVGNGIYYYYGSYKTSANITWRLSVIGYRCML